MRKRNGVVGKRTRKNGGRRLFRSLFLMDVHFFDVEILQTEMNDGCHENLEKGSG
jgi:hypothetical protein